MARKVCDLSTPITVPNVQGWGAESNSPANEDSNTWQLRLTFYGIGGRIWSSHVITVANGTSTRIFRNPSPGSYTDLILSDNLATPTAFDALMNAVRAAANTKLARQKAMADTLLALGVVDASLTGTTS